MNIEYLQHIIEQHFEDHLLQLHDNIKNVLTQKNSEIAGLIAEKERLAQTNEILGEQIRRSYVQNDTTGDSGHDYAEKLHNINIKKKIIDDENAKLKAELMTLKHEKMRDEKLSSDKLSKLNREIKKLRNCVEQLKSPDEENMNLKTLSDQFITYKSQMEIVMDSLNKSLLNKEEEIKRLKKQLMDEVANQPNIKSAETHMSKDLIDALKLNNTVFVKKISELSSDSEDIIDKMRDEESKIPNIEQESGAVTILNSQSVRIKKINEAKENIVVVSNDGSRADDEESAENNVLEVVNLDESMTSSRMYSGNIPDAGSSSNCNSLKKDLKCPLPKCYKLCKFRNIGQVKYHVALHFFKDVTAKYPFVKDQPCSFCNSINKTKSGHVYHYGVRHKTLLDIIPDTNEHKEIAVSFLNLRNIK